MAAAEMSSSLHVHRALGESELTRDYLTAAEDLDLAWDRAQQARWELRKAALEAGWSKYDFTALLRGEVTAQRVDTDEAAAG